MEFRQIQTFMQIAQVKNFSKTAELLGYSQSAVTVQIRQLETELGVRLFDRTGKKVTLTPSGKEFWIHANKIIDEMYKAKDAMNDTAELKNPLHIGTIESLCTVKLQEIVQRFRKEHPQVRIQITIGSPERLIQKMEHNELDVIYILDTPRWNKNWVKVMEKAEPVIFVSAPNYKLAGKKDIEIEEILNAPFYLTERNANYRQALEQELSLRKQTLSPVLECSDTAFIKKMLKTGKGLSYGGSLARTEATGYGLLYLTDELLKLNGIELAGKTVAVSGAGNVAIYAIQKAQQLGAKVVTASDSTGWVYDPDGIDVAALKEIKEVKRARLTEYKNYRPNSEYHEGRGVWNVKVDIALPCATQNELHLEDAKALVANGCIAVCEGANMPTTLEATEYLQENGVIFAPGKAANAGGVATSALEMSQNSERLSWTFEEVDAKLKNIMVNICHNMVDAAERYGFKGNYVVGANIAGFEKVVDAMTAQGIV